MGLYLIRTARQRRFFQGGLPLALPRLLGRLPLLPLTPCLHHSLASQRGYFPRKNEERPTAKQHASVRPGFGCKEDVSSSRRRLWGSTLMYIYIVGNAIFFTQTLPPWTISRRGMWFTDFIAVVFGRETPFVGRIVGQRTGWWCHWRLDPQPQSYPHPIPAFVRRINNLFI